MELIEAFTDGVWEGTARFSVEGKGRVFGPWPVQWDSRRLEFTFWLERGTPDVEALWTLEWEDQFVCKLREVQLKHGPISVSVDELATRQSNPLREWPGNVDDELARLVLAPDRNRIDFDCEGYAAQSPPYEVWWDHWPTSFLPPGAIQAWDARFVAWACSETLDAKSTLLGWIGGDCRLVEMHRCVRMALSLACGNSLSLRMLKSRGTVSVFKQVLQTSPSGLPMFEGAHAVEPLRQMLAAAVQLGEREFEQLRYAAALTVEAKGSHIPLELRFLLLMMCVEMLDERYQLSDDTTGLMLGIAPEVARVFNGMRNQLAHAHHGGGHVAAFHAYIREQCKGAVPQLPEPWTQMLDLHDPSSSVLRLFFQLCERIDAFWCTRLGVSCSVRGRCHVASYARLWPLPPPYVAPPEPEKKTALHSESRLLSLQLKKEREKNADLRDKVAELGDMIRELQGQLLGRPPSPSSEG
jgi:hypothetical protein